MNEGCTVRTSWNTRSTPPGSFGILCREPATANPRPDKLFDRHRDRVFGHACRLVESRYDAEDVTASAFLELWRRRGDVRLVEGSVLPWLLVTTGNVARNSRRGTRRYRQFLSRLPPRGVCAGHGGCRVGALRGAERHRSAGRSGDTRQSGPSPGLAGGPGGMFPRGGRRPAQPDARGGEVAVPPLGTACAPYSTTPAHASPTSRSEVCRE